MNNYHLLINRHLFHFRKTCQSCKCPREAHAIYQEQATSVRERLGFKAEALTSGIDPRQLGYTWVPPGVMTSSKVQRYFDKIPQEKVPKVGTSGERYRERQITYQLPKQDLSLDYCKHVEPQHRASYEDFVAARNEIALDIGWYSQIIIFGRVGIILPPFLGYIRDAAHSTKCATCDERVAQGDLAVIAPKFGDQLMWHPKCFTCATCDELLVDLTYCVHEDKLYCERHYAEMLKPRCNACDEVSAIFVLECGGQ